MADNISNNIDNTDTDDRHIPDDVIIIDLNERKRKSRRKSKVKRIILTILAVIAGIIIAILLVSSPFIYSFVKRYVVFPGQKIEDYYDFVDISMTDEQKLEDLEALYTYAFLSNPTYEARKELYGIDYEALYTEYQEKIVETTNELEYFTVMYDFIAYMGSGHTALMFPHYAEVMNSGFQLNMEALEGKDTKAVYYTWEETLKEQMLERAISSYGYLDYVEGGYAVYWTNSNKCMWPEEYCGARVISIDDIDPISFAMNNPFALVLEYDDVLETPYRSFFMLNDEQKGTPVELELQLVDGTIERGTYYMDPVSELVTMIGGYAFSFESNSSTVEVKDNYELVENDEDDYIYLSIRSCMYSDEDEKMIEELKAALTRHDTLILDLRENGGGYIYYFADILYPYIFTDDLTVSNECIVEKNEVTERWWKDPYLRLDEGITYDKAENVYRYTDIMTYYGAAEQKVNVYVLVSEATFSSADMFTNAISQKDNVTVIGTHTGGEGIEGFIFMYSLPNSRMCYSYSPASNVETKGQNMLSGTEPDVVMYRTLGDFREQLALVNDNKNPRLYENMIKFDDVLIGTVEYIKENR